MNLETYLYDSTHKFTIALQCQGTPCVRIKINNEVKFDQKIDRDVIVDCTADLQKYDPGNISVEMYGKSSRDTIIENGEIVRDTTLTVDDVIINGASLLKIGDIHSGVYHPIYWDNYTGDKPDTIQGARTMGFNGIWKYTWKESPIRHIINHKELVAQTSINKDMHHIFDVLGLT